MSPAQDIAVQDSVNEEQHETYRGETFYKIKPEHANDSSNLPTNASDLPPLQIESLNHVAMDAWDIPAVEHFYTQVLGFKKLPRPEFKFDGLWLQGPGIVLHVIEADPTVPRKYKHWQEQYKQAPEPWYVRRGKHTAFEVPCLAAAEKRLLAFGIEYHKFTIPGTEAAQIFFFDPEGNGIELGQNYKEVAKDARRRSSSESAVEEYV